MVVFEVIGRRLVAVCPSLHDRGRAKRAGVSGSNSRFTLYSPGEIALAWLTGKRSLVSCPAKLGLVQPKRMKQHSQFAGNCNPGALLALGFSDPLAPCLEREGSLDAGQHDVGSFVKRSSQHRIARFGNVATHIALA